MAITVETIERAPEQTIEELMEFLTTILSDSMEKCQTMHAEIKQVYPESVNRMVGLRSRTAEFSAPVTNYLKARAYRCFPLLREDR